MEADRIEEIFDEDDPDWSVSRLQTILTCGRRYQFKYVDRTLEEKTVPLAFGSAVHWCIEQMHLHNIWGETSIELLWMAQWEKAQEGINWFGSNYKKATQDKRGLTILSKYAEKHSQDQWYALEASFRLPFGSDNTIFRGMFDKIQMLTEHPDVPPQYVGRLAIIDYKTGKNPPDELIVSVDPQLTIYAAAAWELFGENVVLGLHHLPSDKIFWTTRHGSSLKEIYKMIDMARRRINNKEFDRNIDYHCRNCPFKRECLGDLYES